jgi:hypothetical protein
MRTERAWAVARADGRLECGTLPAPRFGRVPVLRVLTGLAQSFQLSFGGTRHGPSRSGSWPMIRALLVAEGAVVGLDALAAGAHVPHSVAPLVTVGLWAAAISIFRLVAPAAQWRYHGAEHKAVNAHEQGVDLADTEAVVRRCSRVHSRCGTNLVVWTALLAPAISKLLLAVQLVAFPVAIAVLAEILTWSARHPDAVLNRVLLAPGRALQLAVTTKEPTMAEQEVGCRALLACLDQHRRVSELHPADEVDDEQDHQNEHEGSYADIHGVGIPGAVPA